MSDITVVATVTPSTSAPTGFEWSYSVAGNGFTIPQSNTLRIPLGGSPEIMLNVVPGGQASDTCIFQNPLQVFGQLTPLTFFAGVEPISPPSWYQGLEFLDPSTIVFTDNNINNPDTTTYNVVINVVYNGQTISSPDPTIVNAGTDGSMTFKFGKASSQEQAGPTAVAA